MRKHSHRGYNILKSSGYAYSTVKLPEVMARDPAELLELDCHLHPS